MSAKRKRGSSKKYSKTMQMALEQHREEINAETSGTPEKGMVNPATPASSTLDSQKLNESDGAVNNGNDDLTPNENLRTNDESDDGIVSTDDIDGSDKSGSTDNVNTNDDGSGEPVMLQADDDTSNDDSNKQDANDDSTSTASNDDEEDIIADVDESEAAQNDDDGQQQSARNDYSNDGKEAISNHTDNGETTASSADNIVHQEFDAPHDANTSDASDSDDVSDVTTEDEPDSDDTNDESQVANTNNKMNSDIQNDTDVDTNSSDVTDEALNDMEKPDSVERSDSNDDASSVSFDDAMNKTESMDIADDSDDNATDAHTGTGAHFAIDNVTNTINDSVKQAQSIVDSLTGHDTDSEKSNSAESKDAVPDIGVEIKSAEEIAESVIGKHDDEEEFKKTIAKLDEMIDEETSKAAAEAAESSETPDTQITDIDADIEKKTESATLDSDTETTDGINNDNAQSESPEESPTVKITNWFRSTTAAIKDSVSSHIEEAKEKHERILEEKEQQRKEAEERAEAEKAAEAEEAKNASLTINESEHADSTRNDLTAADASEITGLQNDESPSDKNQTAPVNESAEANPVTAPSPSDSAASDTGSEQRQPTESKNGETSTEESAEPSAQPHAEVSVSEPNVTSPQRNEAQQPPHQYRRMSRRERRRARRVSAWYSSGDAFNRNSYRPDQSRLYPIDPASYSYMKTPIAPDGTPIDPRRIVVIDASHAPASLRQSAGIEGADGRYVSKKQGSGAAIAILIVSMLISGATAAIVTGLVTGTTSSTKSVIQTVADNVNEASKQPAGEAFKNAQASVVSVYSYQATSSYGFGIFGYDPSSDESDSSTIMSGMGSGVVIDENGDIITNAHIVDGYSDIMVKVGDKEYSTSIVGKDSESDLAVIHIEGATDLQAMSFADSSKVGIGDVASTIGAPYGYDKTLSNGVISAINTNGTYETTDGMPMYISLFQTDAVVNAQNAGGALVDSSGNLIGINVQTAGSAGGHGLSFAIPSNYAKKIVDQILEDGEAQHGRIGVELRTDDSGAVAIYSVSKGSSASLAGMKAGDVIISVGDNKVKSPSDFMMAIEEQPIDEYTSIKVKRDGNEQILKVKVEAGDVTPKTKVDGGESTKG